MIGTSSLLEAPKTLMGGVALEVKGEGEEVVVVVRVVHQYGSKLPEVGAMVSKDRWAAS